MAEVKQVTLKRFNGTDDDTLHPTTDWEQVENKPSTFTATAHTLNSHTDVNASPTDGQALVWDGTNSLWVAGEGGGGAASVTISATEPTSPEEGDLWWDSTDGNLYIYYNDGTSSQWVEASAGLGGGSVDKADLQNLYIYGKASVAITKGQAIQFAGAEGDHILIKPAVQSEINANPDYMIGIADSNLAIGEFGYVIVNGRLNLDTSTYTAGNILYFDSAGSTAGSLTTTEPTNGTAILQMAAVSVSGVGTGEFVVRTMLLSREIHEVIGLQTALNSKANLASPALTGTPTAPTATAGTNTTQIATTAFVSTAIDDLVDLAPGSLDTLNELAAALGDDENFASTVTTSLAGKSDVGHTHTLSDITDSGSVASINTNASTTQFLRGDGTWATPVDTNTTYTAGTGLSLSGTQFSNTAPDQTVTITGSGATTVTGTYPNFTVSSTDNNTVYTHPTYAGDDINLDTGALSGATVISDLDFNITSDTLGHITDANATYSTRNLTAANIGAAPASHTHDDRYYTESEVNSLLAGKQAAGTYNTIIGTDSDINTSGSTIIDNIYVTDGVITSMGTRTLTTNDLGATRFYNDAYLNSSTSTASFISELISDYGCFQNNNVVLKLAWSYAGNSDLNTGHPTIGTIELAGCVIETWGGTYKHIRITRPNTGAGGHGVYEYNDQSSGYSPGWREIWTSESDGSGSGLDADLLDGNHASAFYLASNPNGYTSNVGDITGVTAGSGISGGGTSGTVTISHADTSSQGSVNNSSGTVIQDITLDTYGHITALGSVNLDGRYYTESEADSRFINASGDTMTGTLTTRAIAMQNYDLTGVNSIYLNDPGPTEGLYFSNFRIVESPDDLTTNAAGNLHFVSGGARRLSVKTNGNVEIPSNLYVNGSVVTDTIAFGQSDFGYSQGGIFGLDGRPAINMYSIKNWSGALTCSGSLTLAAVNQNITGKVLAFQFSESSGTTVNAGVAIVYYYDGAAEVRVPDTEGAQSQNSRYHRRFSFGKYNNSTIAINQPYYDYESFSTGSPTNQTATSLTTTVYLTDVFILDGAV